MSWFWGSSSSSSEGWFSGWWSSSSSSASAPKPFPISASDLESGKGRLRPVATYPLRHASRVFPEQLLAAKKKIASGRARRANPAFPVSAAQLQAGASRLRASVTYAPGRNAPNNGVDIRSTLRRTTPFMISVTPAIIAAARSSMRPTVINADRPAGRIEPPIVAEFRHFVAAPRLRRTVTRVSHGCVLGRVVD